MKRKELAAVILAAALVAGTLSGHVIQKFIEHDGQQPWQHPEPVIPLGLLTFGVLLFQAWIYRQQTSIMRDQLALMERQHVATHRPRLIVRGCRIAAQMAQRVDGKPYDRIAGIEFFVVNAGASPATIVNGVVNAQVVGVGYEPRYLTLDLSFYMKGVVLHPGQAVSKIVQVAGTASVAQTWIETQEVLVQSDRGIVFYGGFSYADEAGNLHRMAFERRIVPSRGFVASTNPDHEYND